MQPYPHSRELGVTLIELMIVVTIIGIIAGVAYPSYQQYVRETKRGDAHIALTHLASQQERFFADNVSYASNATLLGYATSSPESPDGYWTLGTTGDAAGFTLTATAGGGKSHTDDDCNELSLTSAGLKTAKDKSNNATDRCW